VTLTILAGLIQIIAALAILGTATLATSVWWALCERLVGGGGVMFYTPAAILAALQDYQPSAGTGGFLLQAPVSELVLSNPPFSVEGSDVQR
jgi:hypothetical protein